MYNLIVIVIVIVIVIFIAAIPIVNRLFVKKNISRKKKTYQGLETRCISSPRAQMMFHCLGLFFYTAGLLVVKYEWCL